MTSQPPVIDFDHFIELAGGGPTQAQDMAKMFITHSRDYFEEINTAFQKKDETEWHDSTHKMKGMAAFAGAVRLRKICEHAQKRYQASDSEKDKILQQINHELTDAITSFKTYLNNKNIRE